MSSNKVIDLPALLHSAYVHQIIADVREAELSSILFDWTLCREVDHTAFCLLLNLSYECEERGIKIRHTSHEQNLFYRESIEPLIRFPARSLELNQSPLGAFLSAVDNETTIHSRALGLKSYLRTLPEAKGVNLNPLETLFSELYMNICQHSGFTNGVVFIRTLPDSTIAELIVSDIGVGIPANIREGFTQYSSRTDSEAIQFATQDLVTTKSTEQNYGRGLNTMKTMVAALKGNATIYSGYGVMAINQTGESLAEGNLYHHGTQLRIHIDFRNFDQYIDPDFTEEVIF